MTIFPRHLILDASCGPRCTRCGAVWDRTLAAEADAALAAAEDHTRADSVLQGMLAFAWWHRWCAAGDEAAEVVEPEPVVAIPIQSVPLAPPPRGHCKTCGSKFRNPLVRRCWICKPWRRNGAVKMESRPMREPRQAEGSCPVCGKRYGRVERCFDCHPTPIMLVHRARVGDEC